MKSTDETKNTIGKAQNEEEAKGFLEEGIELNDRELDELNGGIGSPFAYLRRKKKDQN
ncbi:MAG: hypothetical protein K6G03_00460 [Lachnospiraceae bacterium]|nr:hypothetical protein [Lachnospiraceae bacterium]